MVQGYNYTHIRIPTEVSYVEKGKFTEEAFLSEPNYMYL